MTEIKGRKVGTFNCACFFLSSKGIEIEDVITKGEKSYFYFRNSLVANYDEEKEILIIY